MKITIDEAANFPQMFMTRKKCSFAKNREACKPKVYEENRREFTNNEPSNTPLKSYELINLETNAHSWTT